jgi:serine/threonine protein kinase
MSDLVGCRLGRYEIVKLLGAGGMGEVYTGREAPSSGGRWRSRCRRLPRKV